MTIQDRNIPDVPDVLKAIEELTDPQEIAHFFQEYVAYLRDWGANEKVRNDPEGTATRNVGYTLGYYKPRIRSRWRDALPSLPMPEEVFLSSD